MGREGLRWLRWLRGWKVIKFFFFGWLFRGCIGFDSLLFMKVDLMSSVIFRIAESRSLPYQSGSCFASLSAYIKLCMYLISLSFGFASIVHTGFLST